MRRLLATAGLLVLLVAPLAHAQDGGFSGGWSDPAPTDTRDDTPLAYVERPQQLAGSIARDGWSIDGVSFVGVPTGDEVPDGCAADIAPQNAPGGGAGAPVRFAFDATFPCNRTYLVRATVHASRRQAISTQREDLALPLYVAVAIPPAPVSEVSATLKVDGDARTVALEWPANSEPDLLGYVVTRANGDDTDTLGQVDAGERTRFVDDDPPSGATSYQVTAIRNGPDGTVKQVPAAPTSVDVDVPSRSTDGQSAGGGGEGTSGGLTSVVTGQASTGKPNPNLLSSVRARGGSGRPASPPTTFDSGFQETLPFDPSDPQAAAAPPTGDDAVVAVFDEDGDGSILSNKPTLTFIAGGLAVLVGAAVLFYVSRRASLDAY